MGIAAMIALLTAFILVLSSTLASEHGETAMLSQAESQSMSNCPEKWFDASFMDMGCLYFNTTQDLTWDDANTMCQKNTNGTLVDIVTEMQMGFLQMELEVIANAEGTEHVWWTAGTDVGINGRWIWATTLTAVEDYVWQSSYPDASAGYNCLSLGSGFGYLGYNRPCDQMRMAICQIK